MKSYVLIKTHAGDIQEVIDQLRKLKIYAGPEHPHQAQTPSPMPKEN